MNDKYVQTFLKRFRENVFLAIELGKLAYNDIMLMPVKRLDEYLDWKIKFDSDREKARADKLNSIKT